MSRFDLVSRVVDLLRGKDSEVWGEILERAIENDDPYSTRVSTVKSLDVVWQEGVDPEDLVTHLQEKGCVVNEKLIVAFEQEKKREHFAVWKILAHQSQTMIRFDPSAFGIEYESYEPSPFGFDATVDYQKVVEAALKYGFRKPNLVAAFYLRNRFWEAHKYTEGTRYYIGCEPVTYEDGEPPVIPVLDYNRYDGWALNAVEVAPDAPLEVGVAAGQGEYHESTFVFVLPQPQ